MAEGNLDALVGKAHELETALESVVGEIKAEQVAAAQSAEVARLEDLGVQASVEGEHVVVQELSVEPEVTHELGLKHPEPLDTNALPPF